MDYAGITLNGPSMLGLTLSVGIVIDDAIVVLENIFRYIEEKGYSPFQAAIEATREIGLAVTATTLSLVVIFLPGSFHAEHRGQVLQERRADDGIRDHGVTARKFYADTNAECEAAQASQAGKG